jgi:WXG100 family type VII secretion target
VPVRRWVRFAQRAGSTNPPDLGQGRRAAGRLDAAQPCVLVPVRGAVRRGVARLRAARGRAVGAAASRRGRNVSRGVKLRGATPLTEAAAIPLFWGIQSERRVRWLSGIWCRTGASTGVKVNESGAADTGVRGLEARMSELRVTPAEVHRSGVEIGELAATVKSGFATSDTEIASAQPGWVGESATALASMTTEWQRATETHHQNLVEHGSKFTTAAQLYGRHDQSSADSVRNAAETM